MKPIYTPEEEEAFRQKYRITLNNGVILPKSEVRRRIQSACKYSFNSKNREARIDHFLSDEWMQGKRGLVVARIAEYAAFDEIWFEE